MTKHFWVLQTDTESQVCPNSPSHHPCSLSLLSNSPSDLHPASSSPCSTPKAWVRPASTSQGKPEEAQAVAPETQKGEWLAGRCLFFPVIRKKSHWGGEGGGGLSGDSQLPGRLRSWLAPHSPPQRKIKYQLCIIEGSKANWVGGGPELRVGGGEERGADLLGAEANLEKHGAFGLCKRAP